VLKADGAMVFGFQFSVFGFEKQQRMQQDH